MKYYAQVNMYNLDDDHGMSCKSKQLSGSKVEVLRDVRAVVSEAMKDEHFHNVQILVRK